MRQTAIVPSITLLLAMLVLPPDTRAAQAIDGIAAVVDDEVISIGQVQRTAALLQQETLRGVFPQCAGGVDGDIDSSLAAALECLIDTTLVFREVRRFPQLRVTDAEIDATFQEVEEAFGTADFEAELRRWQLTEDELREVVRRQLLVTAYVDTRFREIVQVSDEEVLRAWNEEIVPDMRARGIDIPPIEDVDDEFVRPLLQEREVNRLVQSWISDLRDRATIERRYP